MSRLFGIVFSLLLILACVCFLGCEGDQGPQGPAGPEGPPGSDGEDASNDPPGDMVFGLAITNNSSEVQVGASTVTLTFDQSATPSPETVVCYKLDRPPIIDGEDKNILGEDWLTDFAETGSTVELELKRGESNRTNEARLRSGYDDDYIYFLVQWNEREIRDELNKPDWSPNRWRYGEWVVDIDTSYQGDSITSIDSTFVTEWRQMDLDEDQLYLFWDISGVAGWETSGSDLLYQEGESELRLADGTAGQIDSWHWEAGKTGIIGYFEDEHIDEGGVHFDQGTAAYSYNEYLGFPAYMHKDGPENSSIQPPLNYYDAVPFDPTGWEAVSFIPSYVSILPLGGRADIQCSMSVSSWLGAERQWTVEFKRLRRTGHGDDVQF